MGRIARMAMLGHPARSARIVGPLIWAVSALALAPTERPRHVAAPVVVALRLEQAQVVGGTPVNAQVTLDAPAPAGGFVVVLTSSRGEVRIPKSVTVPARQSRVTFTIPTSLVTVDRQADLTARGGSALGQPVSAALTLLPIAVSTLTLSSATAIGGQSVSGQVQLTTRAPPAGITVPLRSSSTGVIVPSAVLVPGGATGVSFAVNTQPVGQPTTATITTLSLTLGVPVAGEPQLVAGGPAAGSKTAQLSIGTSPVIAGLTVRPSTVRGGQNAIGSLTISPESALPVIVSLVSSRPDVLPVPATVTMTQSQVAQAFTMHTQAVQAQVVVSITALTANPSQKRSFSVTVVP